MSEPSFDVIDRATELIRSHFDVGLAVILTRDHDAGAVPEYGPVTTIDGICRRIVASLLNEGWTPPAVIARKGDHHA